MPGKGFIKFAYFKRDTEPGWSNKPMQDVVELCDPLWRDMDDYEKKRFSIANKSKAPIPEEGKDSYGRNIKDVIAKNLKTENDPENMRRLIRDAFGRRDIPSTVFTVIHTNALCQTFDGDFVPAEICFANFSLAEGIIEIYHDFPDPGVIPRGYKSACKMMAERTHKIPMDLVYFNPNYHNILAKLETMKSSSRDNLLFTTNNLREQTQKILDKLHKVNITKRNLGSGGVLSEEEEQVFPTDVLDITTLLQTLLTDNMVFGSFMNLKPFGEVSLKTQHQLLDNKIRKGVYLYDGIACHLHDEEPTWCSKALVIDWIYAFCAELCPIFGIDLEPSKHIPVVDSLGLCELDELDEADARSISDYADTASSCGDARSDDLGSDWDSSHSEIDLRLRVMDRMDEIKRKQLAMVDANFAAGTINKINKGVNSCYMDLPPQMRNVGGEAASDSSSLDGRRSRYSSLSSLDGPSLHDTKSTSPNNNGRSYKMKRNNNNNNLKHAAGGKSSGKLVRQELNSSSSSCGSFQKLDSSVSSSCGSFHTPRVSSVSSISGESCGSSQAAVSPTDRLRALIDQVKLANI